MFAKRLSMALAVACAGVFAADGSAAPITPGHLVVTRAAGGGLDETNLPGPGTVAPIVNSQPLAGSGVAASVFLDEYTVTGGYVQSIALPNVRRDTTLDGPGNYALTLSGTQNTEGTLTLSQDRRYLVLCGYNATAVASTGSPLYRTTNSAASTATERVVGLVDMNGNYNTTSAFLDVSSAQPFRSAYSTNGVDLWMNGASGSTVTINSVPGILTAGVKYGTVGGSTSTQVISTSNTGHRVLNAFANQLYLSNKSLSVGGNPGRGISAAGTGFPTAPGGVLATLAYSPPLQSGEDPADYWFKDPNTLYVADVRNSTDGGIRKFIFDGANWVFQYALNLGATGVVTPHPDNGGVVGASGLAGTIDDTGATILFATSFEAGSVQNRLWKVTDLGSPASSISTLLALSAVNSAFRGVEFVPVPEPTGLALLGVSGLILVRRRRR